MNELNILRLVTAMGFAIIVAWMFSHRRLNEKVEKRTSRLEKLERFTIADVVSRLSENMVIITGSGHEIIDAEIIIPEDKNGLMFLDANNCVIRNTTIRSSARRVIK